MKVVIVGIGAVGSSIAYATVIKGLATELVLVDINMAKAEGEALDLEHGGAFFPPVKIQAGDYEDCRDADCIVLAAGSPRKPGQDRLELAKGNANIFRDIMSKMKDNLKSNSVIIVVSNPVDILVYLTLQMTGLAPEAILGSGTVLDSSCFRYLLSKRYNVDSRYIHGYIIGEHGASSVPVWSHTNISGIPIENFAQQCDQPLKLADKQEIFEQVLNAGQEVIKRKGATFYAVALSVVEIMEAILRDQHSVLTISSLVRNYYWVTEVCLSVPTILGKHGIVKRLRPDLNESEVEAFQKSGKALKDALDALNL